MEYDVEGSYYLTTAYLGMIAGLAIWTWTVVTQPLNRVASCGSRIDRWS